MYLTRKNQAAGSKDQGNKLGISGNGNLPQNEISKVSKSTKQQFITSLFSNLSEILASHLESYPRSTTWPRQCSPTFPEEQNYPAFCQKTIPLLYQVVHLRTNASLPSLVYSAFLLDDLLLLTPCHSILVLCFLLLISILM